MRMQLTDCWNRSQNRVLENGAGSLRSVARTIPSGNKMVMSRLFDTIHLILKVLLGVLIAGLLIPVTMQILSRYTGIIPRYIWTEEIARFCFIWIVMLGAICAVRDRTHFDLDVLPESRNPTVEGIKQIIVHVAILAVGGFFVWYGVQFVQFGWHQTSEIFELPMPWMFVSWPIAGILFIAFELEQIVKVIRELRGQRT